MSALIIDLPRALRDDNYRQEISGELEGYSVTDLRHDAADAIEQRDARIAELEAALAGLLVEPLHKIPYERARAALQEKKGVFESGELDGESNTKNICIARSTKPVRVYSLDAIISAIHLSWTLSLQRFARCEARKRQFMKKYGLASALVRQTMSRQIKRSALSMHCCKISFCTP